MIRVISFGAPVLTLAASLAGCAHKVAECDYKQLVGSCSASVDPSDTALVLHAARCSQVELRADSRTRVIRTDSGVYPIASADSNVEVVSCRSYKDMRGE
jgi:hypothetical protein